MDSLCPTLTHFAWVCLIMSNNNMPRFLVESRTGLIGPFHRWVKHDTVKVGYLKYYYLYLIFVKRKLYVASNIHHSSSTLICHCMKERCSFSFPCTFKWQKAYGCYLHEYPMCVCMCIYIINSLLYFMVSLIILTLIMTLGILHIYMYVLPSIYMDVLYISTKNAWILYIFWIS